MIFYLFTKFYIRIYKSWVVMGSTGKSTRDLLLDFASMIEVDL